jgi:ribosomal protein L2
MALKKFNPTTPSQRNLVLVDKSALYKGKPVKKLTEGLSKTGGRNNSGHVTSWQRGGGHKRRYRLVDFKRRKQGIAATVERIEYDPNRTAFIALLTYEDGEQSYILAPQRLAVGDKVEAGPKADIKPGNALPIANIPVGTLIHNVELKPVRVASLRVLLGLMFSWLAAIVGTLSCALLLVKFVWCGLSVWRPLARYPTQISRISKLVKLAVIDGLASAHMFAAL